MTARNMRIALLLVLVGGGLWLSLSRSVRWAEPWIYSEWNETQAASGIPQPSHLGKASEAIRFGAKTIRWAAQELGGYELLGSFIKTTEENGRLVEVQARYVTSENFPSEKLLSEKLDEPAVVAECLSWDKKPAALVNTKGKWQWVQRRLCEKQDEIVELAYDRRGKLMNSKSVSANLDRLESNLVLYPLGPALSQLQNVVVDVASQPNILFSPSLEVRSDAGLQFQNVTEVRDIQPTDPRFDMAQVYYFGSKALDWVHERFQLNLQPLRFRTHVGHPENANVAFYHSREVRLGTGDGVTFEKMAWDPTIVVHESMHYIVEALTHMPFQKEPGSLSEAMADSLTALHLQTPDMGAASYKKGSYQRSLREKVRFDEKNGKMYHDSLIVSGLIWQIKEETGDPVALDLTRYLLSKFNPSSNLEVAREQVRGWFASCSEGERCDRIGHILSERGFL
ncbi:MAG: hypothetical protein AB7F86_12965 [Bdellovibrionales bacterium]